LLKQLGAVGRHRGTVFVSSQPGSGTSLRVLLPTRESTRTKAEIREEMAESWSASGRVLVIDDEAGIRRFARILLEETGFDVELAADGDQALELLAGGSESPDLILLDLTMPRRSGIEVLAEVRRTNAELPVVLMSGLPESDVAEVLESDPRTRFLQKPFSGETLEQVVRSVLATGRIEDS